jgi:hypothetical protein
VSDQSWFPQPPPKPLKAPPAGTLVFGALVIGIAVVAAVVGITSSHHSSRKVQPAAQPAATTSSNAQQGRSAFAACLQSMGASSGSRVRGRFSRGPSKSFRTAVDICRRLAQPDGPAPAAPSRTGTTPPVA